MVSQVRRGPCIEKSISIPIFNYTKWKTFRCIPISNQYCKKQISSWKLPMQSKHLMIMIHNDHFHSLEKTSWVIFIFLPISWRMGKWCSSFIPSTQILPQWETGKTVNMEKNQTFILVPWQLKPDFSSDKFFIKLSEVGILLRKNGWNQTFQALKWLFFASRWWWAGKASSFRATIINKNDLSFPSS